MAATLEFIRDWALELPYWEQAALDRIATGTVLAERDYQELLEFCMQDAGLIAMPPRPRPLLTFPARLPVGAEDTALTVERLYDLKNVNALPEGQEIRFGSQLTIIYGANGAGKTSFVRPLGCAAFARGDREVLTDARNSDDGITPAASIEISENGQTTTVAWEYGSRCPELSHVYVFDSVSIGALLTRPNSLSFSPAGLSLLTQLAETTDIVRERLRGVIQLRSTPNNFGSLFVGDSSISREIATLGAKTDLPALTTLASLTNADEERVEEMDRQIAELKSRNVPKRIAELQQEIRDLQSLLQNLEAVGASVGSEVENEVTMLAAAVVKCKAEAERVGADQFKFEQLTQVGSGVWREFISKAKALADAEGQRGISYPQPGDACLLCRQTLSPEALDLIQRMWEFLSSDAPARYEAAQRAASQRARRFDNVSLLFFGPDAPVRRILDKGEPALVSAIESYLQVCATRIIELRTALTEYRSSGFTPTIHVDYSAIRAAVESRTAGISKLETADTEKEIKVLENSRRELEHRRVLRDHLADIKAWVNTQKWIVRAQNSGGSTRHITAKYNELFKVLVTDQYRDQFRAMLKALKRNLNLTIETRGHKGETVRQIVLSPEVFAQKIAIDRVLSEGEKRAVALVDFLTEVSLDPVGNAIVLDDPVSSFDTDSKNEVAQLLAAEAAKRQVIVFTHDLVFLYALKASAKKLSVGVVSHWVRCEGGEPGYVYLDNSPLCEGDYKSANIARRCYADAKKAAPAEQERLLQQGFGALRTSYEAFVIYSLFNGVVQRFEERVAFDQLKDINLDREIVDQVVEKLGTLSRHIDAHLHSDIFASNKPTPELLLEEIEAFEALRKKHKSGKNTEITALKGGVKKIAAAEEEPKSDTVPLDTPVRVQ